MLPLAFRIHRLGQPCLLQSDTDGWELVTGERAWKKSSSNRVEDSVCGSEEGLLERGRALADEEMKQKQSKQRFGVRNQSQFRTEC